jgi:hypothetical protein
MASTFTSQITGYTAVAMVATWTDGPHTGQTYLTDCCRASATGTSVTVTNPHGVSCRGCYRPVDPRLGAVPGLDGLTVKPFGPIPL